PSKVFFFGNFEYIPLGFDRPLGGITFAPTAAGFDLLAANSRISSTNLGILRNAVGTVGPATQFTTINGINVPLGQVTSVNRSWQNQIVGTGGLDFTPWEKDQFHVRYIHI